MAVLVVADHDNTALVPIILNTVTAAAAINDDVHLLVAGENAGAAAEAAARVAGVSAVLHAYSPAYGHQLAEAGQKVSHWWMQRGCWLQRGGEWPQPCSTTSHRRHESLDTDGRRRGLRRGARSRAVLRRLLKILNNHGSSSIPPL